MKRRFIALSLTAASVLGASAQEETTTNVREVNGGVDFESVYNMGAKETLNKWSVQARGGLNLLSDIHEGDDSYLKLKSFNGQAGLAAEYSFTQYWGLGAEFNWIYNNQQRYDNQIFAIGLFTSANLANLLAPYRSWKNFNAYLNFGAGLPITTWKNAYYYQDNTKKTLEDGTTVARPYIKPGIQFEYNINNALAVGVFCDLLYGLTKEYDKEDFKCIHPTSYGGQTVLMPGASIRYKFKGERNIRNTNLEPQPDYRSELKDQLTLINRQARKLDSLTNAATNETANLREEIKGLKTQIATQQNTIEYMQKSYETAGRRAVTINENDTKIIKASLTNLRFESGKATIVAESYPSLDQLAELIKGHSEWNVMLSGYTDNAGDPQKNLILSRDRAAAVKAYLVQKGIDSNRIQSTGYGDKDPIATNNTPEGRSKNRRVELDLYTK